MLSIQGSCRAVVAHDDNGRATPGGVIVVRVAGVVLDVFGGLRGTVVRRGQLIVDNARCLERGKMIAGG